MDSQSFRRPRRLMETGQFGWNASVVMRDPWLSRFAAEVTGLVVTAFNVVVSEHGIGLSISSPNSVNPYSDNSTSRLRVSMCAVPNTNLTFLPIREVDEIMVITQMWGMAVYHYFGENLSKVAYLQGYLRRYPHVLLHLPADPRHLSYIGQGLAIFNIPLNRTIWGSVRARIAHFPEGSGCGGLFPSFQLVMREQIRVALDVPRSLDIWGNGCRTGGGLASCFWSFPTYHSRILQCVMHNYLSLSGQQQPMANTYRNAIAEHQMQLEARVHESMQATPILVLVKRKGARHIVNYDELKRVLLALPIIIREHLEGATINDVFLLYSNASIIVAPHGAAQVNNIMTPPGAHLVEFNTFQGTNFMYHSLSCTLGHNYSFFMPKNSTYGGRGGFKVDVKRVAAHISSVIHTF